MSIYLDNSATSPIDSRVLEAMIPYFKGKYANPSSIHNDGRAVRDEMESARGDIAALIGADPSEIIFTASGSESDNLAIKGIVKGLRGRGSHIITSKIEHKAVLETCSFLEGEGFDVTYLPVDKYGTIDVEEFKNSIRDDTILVSVMLANNEIGSVQPLTEMAQVCRDRGILVHTDAVQAIGKMNVDVNELGVHLLTFSGHKIYAPKGIGVLYVDESLKDFVQPLIHGGHHEFGLRAGTENVPYIIGLSEACRIIDDNLQSDIDHIKKLRDKFENRVLSEISNTYVNGTNENRIPSISNITFQYIEGEALMVYASEICCSTGSACTSESVDASHVLYAINADPVDMHGALRFSFGRFNTEEEVDRAVDILKENVMKLRKMSPLLSND